MRYPVATALCFTDGSLQAAHGSGEFLGRDGGAIRWEELVGKRHGHRISEHDVMVLVIEFAHAVTCVFSQFSRSDRRHATRPSLIRIGDGKVPARRLRQQVTTLKPTTSGRNRAATSSDRWS